MIEILFVQVLILLISLVLLASSSHFTIKSLLKLIDITGLSEASAGFVILAVMTSTPEMIVAFFSILQGNAAISIGDILGSNIFNIALVIGLLGTLGFLKMCCTEFLVELTDILFFSTLIPLLLLISHFHIVNVPSPIVGFLLLGAFIVNTFMMIRKRTPPIETSTIEEIKREKLLTVVIKFLLSFIGVSIAARLVVYSGYEITLLLGASPLLIGAKVIAIGTSLPELTTSLIAVRRGHIQLAIADIIGSNLTNLTLVLGIVLLISPFDVGMTLFTEILPFLLISTILFWRFLTRGGISQMGGIMLILTYIAFQAILI